MPRPIPTKDIKKSLLSKGFQAEEGRRHLRLRLYINDKATCVVISLSRGITEYGNELLGWVKKESGLDTLRQVTDLIECSMSYEVYVEYLREKDVVRI